jgi:DnaJ-class molecular chaperone
MTRPDGQGRGDLYVEARVWVPAVRDDESRELLRQFERRHHHDPRRGLGVPAPATVPAPEGKAR